MNITDSLLRDIAHVGDVVLTPSGDFGTIEGLANLKNALFHRLITTPGSLIHRPTYGVGILQYQNAPTSFSIQQQLATVIQEQFEEDPRVNTVSSVKLESDDGTSDTVIISVVVDVAGYGETAMIFAPFGATP